MRITVISPFVDKKHGTERCLAELLERLVCDYQCKIYLYAQRVEDLAVKRTRKGLDWPGPGIVWYKVTSIPGPHLLQYVWWFTANTVVRWWHRRMDKFRADVLFSPGINAWDAETIHVHIVFEEFYRRMTKQLSFHTTPLWNWPTLVHRRLYYRLARWLEGQIYSKKKVRLAAVSGKVQHQLETYFQRWDAECVRNGVALNQFSPALRQERRVQERAHLQIPTQTFVFLLIGNDWRKKGLHLVFEAFSRCKDLPIHLLVVGSDRQRPFLSQMRELNIDGRVSFLPPGDDVIKFYASADAYVGPSLEDAFGLPVLEAMACGLPVIASTNAGVSELIEDGFNGLLLRNVDDVDELTTLMRNLVSDASLREALGTNGVKTAERCTWDVSAAALWAILSQTVMTKRPDLDTPS